jgi:signal transduction histidine kinase
VLLTAAVPSALRRREAGEREVAGTRREPTVERPAAVRLPLVRWCRRHPLFTDAALVVALVALTSADIVHRSVIDIVWQAALWLPVIFRRTAPLAAFVLVGVVAAGQWAFDVPLGGDLAVLIVLYTVAAHRSRILAVAAAAAVEVGVVLAVLRFGHELWPRFLLLLTILVVAAVSLGITQQARRSHLTALTDRADRLEREGLQLAQLAAAAERTRIAREMHDIVAHSLAVMITLADGATLTDDPDQARTAMRQVARTGREALADTRRVLDVLRTETGPADLAPLPGAQSLEALLTSVRATGLRTSLTVSGAAFAIPEAAQLAIYRIVQEALTNTLKHARDAGRATVRLSYDHPLIRLEISDDGTATEDPAASHRDDSAHGLLGIRERAALFHGSFTAGRSTSGGWHVAVTLRLPELRGSDSPAEPAGRSPSPAPPSAAPVAR